MPQFTAQTHEVCQKTITNKIKNKHLGKQSVLSSDEEDSFVSCIITMSDYRFPLTSENLRNIISCYLGESKNNSKIINQGKMRLQYSPLDTFYFNYKICCQYQEQEVRRRWLFNKLLHRHLTKELQRVLTENIYNFDGP